MTLAQLDILANEEIKLVKKSDKPYSPRGSLDDLKQLAMMARRG